MTETPRRRKLGSGTLDRVIIAVIAVSIVVLGLGVYAITTLGSHEDVLPYRIAYSSVLNDAEMQENLFVLGRDGESEQVTTSPVKDLNPAWSPDGKRLLFARGGAIWVQDDDGTRQLSDNGAASYPKFSLDGTRIAYANDVTRMPDLGHIWLMAADGSNQHPISNSVDPNTQPGSCFGGFPAGWYPGTNRILYRGSFPDGSLAICSVNEDGTDVQTILQSTAETKLNFSPALSPDGARIAFISTRSGKNQLYLMNPDGSGVRLLFSDTGNDDTPAWSPDGAWLAFASDRDGESHIYMIHPDGSGLTQLTFGSARDISPAWAPNAP